MTLPDERARSLRWAHELLTEIATDPEVLKELRVRAEDLRLVFPTTEFLQALVTSKAEHLPSDVAAAIEAARILFVETQLSTSGSPATRKGLLYTLRHYPLQGSATTAANARFAGGIESWIAFEP